MRDTNRIVSLIFVIAAFIISTIAYPRLPAVVPIHWDAVGHANGFGGRLEGAFVMPVVMLVVWIFLSFVPRSDRSLFIRYDSTSSDTSTDRPAYGVMISITLAFLLAIHVFAMASSLGLISAARSPLVITALISLGLIAIGNYLPRVTKRNAFIGFRVPWAYASDEVWRRTQRAAGYGMVLAGTVGLVGIIAIPTAPMRPLIVAIIAQLLVVMVYSYSVAHSRSA
jgi:uncharacterized membrane protein